MSVESGETLAETHRAGRIRRVAETLGAGAVGLFAMSELQSWGGGLEVGFIGGGVAFLLAYRGLKNLRAGESGNS